MKANTKTIMTKRILLYLLACLLLTACSKDDEGGGTVAFSVAMSNIEAYSATATITHNGSNRDKYYAFFVEGNVSNARQEVDKLLNSERRDVVLANAMNQRKHVVKVTGLSPRKTFTYIVFGLDASGTLYGEPAATTFSTTAPPFTAVENSNWTVTYQGPTVYNNWDYSLVNVHLEGDVEERYILVVCGVGEAATFDTMEDFIVHAIDDFTRQKNEQESEDFWLDASQVRTGSTNFYRYLEPGDYEAYAFGVNADGTPTGSYAHCDAFHVDRYPYTETYANLMGDWYFVDQNDKWYFVTFSERIVNRSLNMSGWGNYDEFSVIVNYDRTTSALTIPYQGVTAEETTLHFSDGDETGYVYLVGAYLNAENKLRWTRQSHTIAKGVLQDDGSYAFDSAFTMTLTDGTQATQMGMTFVVQRSLSDRVGFGRMMFPFTLKKLEE